MINPHTKFKQRERERECVRSREYISPMRWCPTPDQLMILEEMYRGGLKTPNASQIQKITAHLSLYGRIEGKNVFYWFQNHKARDRQKLRRKLWSQQLMYHQHELLCHHYHPPKYDHLIFHNQLQYSPSSSALHQVGRVEDSSAKPMNCKWKVDVQERIKKMDSTSSFLDNKTWDSEWMIMMDEGPTLPPYCFNRVPLKTLQLFPITCTTTLKDNKLT